MSKKYCRWNDSPLISEVILNKPKFGNKSAVLFAPLEGDKTEALRAAQMELFQRYNMNSYPDFVNGRHVLVVEAYEHSSELFKAMHTVGLISSDQPDFKEEIEKDKELGFLDKINHWRHGGTLKAAGVAGLAGHAMMAASGKIEDDLTKVGTAGMLAINSGLYARYGNGAGDLDYTPILKQMRDDLAKNHVSIAPTVFDQAIETKLKKRPLLKKGEDVVGRNVIEINEGIGLASQIGVMKSGLGGAEGGSKSPMFFLAGLVSAIGNGVAIFLPEVKKKDQDPDLQKSFSGRVISWLEEAPLRFLGYATLIQNGLFFADVYAKKNKYENIAADKPTAKIAMEKGGEKVAMTHAKQIVMQTGKLETLQKEVLAMPKGTKKELEEFVKKNKEINGLAKDLETLKHEVEVSGKGKKVWLVPLAMGALYTLATLLMTVTFKNRAESQNPETAHNELFSRAAMMALQLPAGEQRDHAISLMGMSLFSSHEVKGLTAAEITTLIHNRAEALASSPWRDELIAPQVHMAEAEQAKELAPKTHQEKLDKPSTKIHEAIPAAEAELLGKNSHQASLTV